MVTTLNTLADFEAAPINGSSSPRIALAQEEVREISLSGEGCGMIRTKFDFERLDQLTVKRFGSGIIPFVREQVGKIVFRQESVSGSSGPAVRRIDSNARRANGSAEANSPFALSTSARLFRLAKVWGWSGPRVRSRTSKTC